MAKTNGTVNVVDPQPSTPSPDLLGDLLSPLAIEGPPAAAAAVQSDHNAVSVPKGAANEADALAIELVGEQANAVQVRLYVA